MDLPKCSNSKILKNLSIASNDKREFPDVMKGMDFEIVRLSLDYLCGPSLIIRPKGRKRVWLSYKRQIEEKWRESKWENEFTHYCWLWRWRKGAINLGKWIALRNRKALSWQQARNQDLSSKAQGAEFYQQLEWAEVIFPRTFREGTVSAVTPWF